MRNDLHCDGSALSAQVRLAQTNCAGGFGRERVRGRFEHDGSSWMASSGSRCSFGCWAGGPHRRSLLRWRLPDTRSAHDHGGRRRLQRFARAPVENRTAKARRRNRTDHRRLPLSARHVEGSSPKGLHLRPLAERCVSLSAHTAPIRQIRRYCFDSNARTVCAACWQWSQSFGQPVFCVLHSACTYASPTRSMSR